MALLVWVSEWVRNTINKLNKKQESFLIDIVVTSKRSSFSTMKMIRRVAEGKKKMTNLSEWVVM